jgi:alpha-mannosidase
MALTRRDLLQYSLAVPALAQPKPLEEVVVVFKTHFDIGYTDLAREVVNRYRTSMIDNALDLIDRSQALPPEQRFVWTVSGWPMTQILWNGQDERRRKRVIEALRRGQLAVHALAFSTHTESLDLEDLVSGLGFSSRLHRSLGKPLARDAKMTDVPSHSWVLPVLLRGAGVEFLHLGCNSASSSPEVPLLYWWEGADGSRLLTMYSAGGYGSQLTPPPGWNHPVWLALIHSGDNQGPPAPEAIEKLIEQGKRDLPGVRIRFGRLSDFSDALLKSAPRLPVVRGDMPDTWIHGLQSMPAETALVRRARPRISALESLHRLLEQWAPGNVPAADIAAAREQSLLCGEHTWGMDAKKFPRLYGEEWQRAFAAGTYRKAVESYEEHGSYARKADSIAAPALLSHLTDLARSVKVAGERLVVFNPLAWARSGMVELPAPAGGGITGLRDVASGAVTAAEVRDGKLRFRAAAVPATGYRTYVAVRGDAPAERSPGMVLENEFLRVTVSPEHAGATSIVDKASGRELLDAASGFAAGQYLHERFGNREVQRFLAAYVKTKESWGPGDFGKPGLPGGAYQRTLARDAGLSSAAGMVTLRWRNTTLAVLLDAGARHVDFVWTITGKEPDPWAESGWMCLPLRVASPSFRLARLGGIVDPARDTVRGSNHSVFCLNSGMAAIDAAGAGAGICPIDSPLVSIGAPGSWSYMREFAPRPALVFVNLFNNQWSTNFAQWVGGTWTSQVRLWPIAKFDAAADLIVPSLEARSPLVGGIAGGPEGTLPATQDGVSVSRPGVVVTAFGANPDGQGTVLRLWEHAGVGGACTVTLPAGFHAGWLRRAGLRGNTLAAAAVPVRDGKFTVDVGPFAQTSFLIS